MKRLLIVLFVVAAGIAAVGGYAAASRERQYRDLIAVGDAALARDDTFVALEAFSGAIALKQEAMLAYLKRGQVYHRRGDLHNAERDLRTAMSLDPTSRRVLEALGDVSYALREFERAADRYAEAVALDDADARVQYKLGLAWYHAGRPAAAIRPLTRASELDPRHVETYYVLGLAQHDLRKMPEAVKALRTAVSMEPAFMEARAELALAYQELGRHTDEIEQLEALAALRPGPERSVPLGLAYARAGRMNQAVLTLGTAAERFPDSPQVYVALGRVWLEAAEERKDRIALGKAMEALEGALTAAEPTSEALALFGHALLLAGDVETAEQTLLDAVGHRPVEPLAYVRLADASERLGHASRAKDALVNYRAIVGEEAPGVEQRAGAARIADLARRSGDMATAVEWYRRAATAFPSDGRLHARLAETAWAAGNESLARSALATAVSLRPSDPLVRALQRRIR